MPLPEKGRDVKITAETSLPLGNGQASPCTRRGKPIERSTYQQNRRKLLTHAICRLAIEYDSVVSFVLDENGVITKLRFLGMDDDGVDNDPLARLDAEFVLITATLRKILGDLKNSLGGFA